MGLGLRKLKSEKDIRGKLRKQPRESEDSSTAPSRHQRIPSIAPVLPLPSHIARSALPTSTCDPSNAHLQVRAGSSTRYNHHHHRRSRSFSALTSFISPHVSSLTDQHWRSRDAWLAIHAARTPSPPPTTTIPSAPGGSEAGWRRKGNGGFFARELAGVGETSRRSPQPAPTRIVNGRSPTMGSLVEELEKSEVTPLVVKPIPREGPTLGVPPEQHDVVTELNFWKPGFATSLFRKKTQCAKLSPSDSGDTGGEIPIPTPLLASRPESRCLPDSPPPAHHLKSPSRDLSSPSSKSPLPSFHIPLVPLAVHQKALISTFDAPPPPPSFRQPKPNSPPLADDTPSLLHHSSSIPTRCSASNSSMSARTSQSSSLHTYESAELHYRNLDTGETSIHPPTPDDRRVSATRSSHYTFHRLSSHHDHTPEISDRPLTRSSSLLHGDDLPTIITPTSTYYPFTPPQASVDEAQILIFPSLRDGYNTSPSPTRKLPRPPHHDSPPTRMPPQAPFKHDPLPSKLPHQQHVRDETLPALLPLARIPLREMRSEQLNGDRMKDVPWARAQVARPEREAREPKIGAWERRGSQIIPSRQRVMDRVREMGESPLLPSGRSSVGGDERRSRDFVNGRRGSETRETVRGGWV